jgi:hypothetical protein
MVQFGGYSVAGWKLFTLQQDIDEVCRSYAETKPTVKADADPACTVMRRQGLAPRMGCDDPRPG